MATKRSAGILVFRRTAAEPEVLIGHLGGPFWTKKDAAGWSIPKGEIEPDETELAAARREFTEELSLAVPPGQLHELGTIAQRGGKQVSVWAIEADPDLAAVVLGTFELEWPPRSGTMRQFPELDRVEWSALPVAAERLITGQRVFLDRLVELLAAGQ